MAEINQDTIKDLSRSITGMFNVFKSSAEKTHDTLVKRRDANSKAIDELKRQMNEQTRSGPPTADGARIINQAQNKIAELEKQSYDRIQKYKANFGQSQLKHQEKKKDDPAYAQFTKGKTKGDVSRMDKIRESFYKNGLGILKNISKKIGDFIKAPFKAIAGLADKGLKGILLGLGLLSFIKFIEGIQKASKWFGDNPTFGDILSSGLANLIGFFTGANEEERKKLAISIKEKYKKLEKTLFYVIDSFSFLIDTMHKLFTGDFEGVIKNFEKDGSAYKFFTALGVLALVLPGLTTSVLALSAALVPIAKLAVTIGFVFDLVSEALLGLQKMVRYGQAIVGKVMDMGTGPSIEERYQKGMVKDVSAALDIIKKGNLKDATIFEKMDGNTQQYNLSNFLADKDNKGVVSKFLETANEKDIAYINKMMKERKEGFIMPFMDSIKGQDQNAIEAAEQDEINKELDQNFKNIKRIEKIRSDAIKLQNLQLVPDEATALSKVTRFDGKMLAIDKLTDTLQDYFSKQMPSDIKVNNTSINNNTTAPKSQFKYFTPSKGKGPYSNVLT